ncbi:hypothetical protein [Pseudomonas caspiana]|uniref:hypothetical protein n=1 Tax=Pseudomonas caspiana TaxID=1451454 RepID=UPI0032F03696
MTTLNKFFLALAFLGGSAAAQAADSGNEVSRAPLNKSGERVDRFGESGRSQGSSVWSQGLSEQGDDQPHADRLYYSAAYDSLSGTYNGVPVAQKTLSGHYDLRQAHAPGFSAEEGDSQSWKPGQQVL